MRIMHWLVLGQWPHSRRLPARQPSEVAPSWVGVVLIFSVLGGPVLYARWQRSHIADWIGSKRFHAWMDRTFGA